jgi:hypothetical protein
MKRSSVSSFRAGIIGLSVVATTAVCGCRSRDSGLSPTRPSPDVTNVVQKPVYPVEGTKPLFLGGYAGGFYGSSTLRGGRGTLDPLNR